MKEIITLKNDKMTISSLELLEMINFFRAQEDDKALLLHKTLMETIRDEFSEEFNGQKILSVEGITSADSPPIRSSYKDKKGEKRPMYELTTLQAKQLLARESKVVRKALLIYIEKLETLLRERQAKIRKFFEKRNPLFSKPLLDYR